MSQKHCRTLCAIFEESTRANIRWADFLALCRALGAELPKPGKTAGSRQRIALRGRKTVLHKPHPEPTMKKGSVESARDFLKKAGVTPQMEGCQC
ncbi:MAG: type II toxin-antitoxin system HicA family toxin [Nitrospinae bacterium]|nr:type II toxin-antitoxin system HicA family toxin [Nitrospinota bacterium]